jgi:hypothetical protein
MRAIWLAIVVAGAGLVTACNDSNRPGNESPTADFSHQCTALRCDFQDASTDDVEIVSWRWNFGPAGSTLRNPHYIYQSAGSYQVSLTVTDGEGETSTTSKTVDPKDPVISTLLCVDASVPGGLVACTLKLEEEAGFKVVLESTSCEAHGNLFRITGPEPGTLTRDGCYEQPGKQLVYAAPYPAGTEISAEMVAPLLVFPPQLRVSGAYPEWVLTYEDGVDHDFNDMVLILTALPTGN